MAKKIKILGQGKYAVSENQQFIDRTGQLVRPIRGPQGKPTLIPVGEAYGFFASLDIPQVTLDNLSLARERSQTSSDLEIYLIGNTDDNPELVLCPELKIIAKDAREAGWDTADASERGWNYVIRSYYPNQTNKNTADELRGLFKNSSLFSINPHGSNSFNRIVYREAGRYHSRE